MSSETGAGWRPGRRKRISQEDLAGQVFGVTPPSPAQQAAGVVPLEEYRKTVARAEGTIGALTERNNNQKAAIGRFLEMFDAARIHAILLGEGVESAELRSRIVHRIRDGLP